MAGIHVDEQRTTAIERDRQTKREVAPETPGRSPVGPLGQDPPLNAKRLEGGHLLRFGRKPGQVQMVEHIVQREEASHQHLRGGDPSAWTAFSSERSVDAPPADAAHAADAPDANRLLFDGHALRDESADSTADLLVVATQEARPLRPGEDAAVETGQSYPLGSVACPAEGRKRLLTSLQMSNRFPASRTHALLARTAVTRAASESKLRGVRREPLVHDVHVCSRKHGVANPRKCMGNRLFPISRHGSELREFGCGHLRRWHLDTGPAHRARKGSERSAPSS